MLSLGNQLEEMCASLMGHLILWIGKQSVVCTFKQQTARRTALNDAIYLTNSKLVSYLLVVFFIAYLSSYNIEGAL